MNFFSFLKYNFIIFAAHLATSGGESVCRSTMSENHWCRYYLMKAENNSQNM
jgi:hypothetical protein